MHRLFFAIAAFVGFGLIASSAEPQNQSEAWTFTTSSTPLNDWLRKESPALSDWDIGGQIRVRYDMRSYFATPGQPGAIDFREHGGNSHNDYLLIREKVHAGYLQPWFGVYAEARDSSTSGDERDPNPEADEFDLLQGFVTIGNPKVFPLSIKVGRQELLYGDERLIGISEFSNFRRSFDAVKVRYESPRGWVDLFTARPVLIDNHSFNTANEYETFSGAYASTKALIPKHESQLYFLSRNVEVESPFAHEKDIPQSGGVSARDIYTAGLRLRSATNQFSGWDYGTEIIGQFGRFKEGAATLPAARMQKSLSHRAFAFHAGGSHTWTNLHSSPRVGLEYNFATGDSNPKDGKHETFDNLYPSNHRYYGMMDFFSLQNMHNLRLASSVSATKRLALAVDYHLFWLADTADSFYTVSGARRGGLDPTGGQGFGINPKNDSFAGSEIDIVLTCRVTASAFVQAGYGHFFKGGYINQSLSDKSFGATDADYVYLMTILNF